jgi:hypothetical protein
MNRKYDFEIAMNVMKWKLYNYDRDEYAKTDKDIEDASYNDGWIWEGRSDKEAWEWQPSSDISCALELVNKIPLRFSLIKESDNSKERKYKCWFTKEDGENGYPVS